MELRAACFWALPLSMVFSTGCGSDSDPAANATPAASSATSGGGGEGGAAGAGGDGGAAGAGGSVPPPPDPTHFRETANMERARRCHTMTLLEDGRVLVVGGEFGDIPKQQAEVEVFDPATETWTELDPLPAPRSNHTATRLADGRVLVTGGGKNSIIGVPSGEEVTDSALLFDPATNAFTPTGSMHAPRAAHRAELLPDGRVLVAGGGADEVWDTCAPMYPDCFIAVTLSSAEVYDPATGEFSEVLPMADSRVNFTLTPTSDGPLAVGGVSSDTGDSLKTAELFDAAAGTWKSAGELIGNDRLHHAAALLGSGHVLVAGGKKSNVGPQKSAELFDPAASAWTLTAPIDPPRTGAVMLTLASGHALHAGGFNQIEGESLDSAAVFDEATGAWTEIGALSAGRSLLAGVVLADGRALICGGDGGFGAKSACDVGE